MSKLSKKKSNYKRVNKKSIKNTKRRVRNNNRTRKNINKKKSKKLLGGGKEEKPEMIIKFKNDEVFEFNKRTILESKSHYIKTPLVSEDDFIESKILTTFVNLQKGGDGNQYDLILFKKHKDSYKIFYTHSNLQIVKKKYLKDENKTNIYKRLDKYKKHKYIPLIYEFGYNEEFLYAIMEGEYEVFESNTLSEMNLLQKSIFIYK